MAKEMETAKGTGTENGKWNGNCYFFYFISAIFILIKIAENKKKLLLAKTHHLK